jgi:hypothetical protein
LRARRPRQPAAIRIGAWLAAGLAVAIVAAAVLTAVISRPGTGGVLRSPAALRSYLRSLRLINYFPSQNGWQYMWTRWEPARVNADFAIMAGLGANAVRITVFPAVTGFPVPSQLMQSRLAQVIDMASRHRLKVQLSLFDQFTGFSDIEGSETWAHDILAPFAGSPQIAFIDLRNELDGSTTMGRPDVYRWVDALLPAVEHDAAGIPVTLSVSHPQDLKAMRDALSAEPDFWDLHYYSPDALARVIMEQAVRAAAPLPVFVGETGFATAGDPPQGLPAGQASMQAYQAHYYQVIEQAALSLGLGTAAPWALYDFTLAGIPGRQPPEQYAFGLLHTDGTPKPAAAVIRRLFRTGTVSQNFNNDFTQAVSTPHGMLPAVWRLWQPGQARFAWDPAVGYHSPDSARISHSAGPGGGAAAFYTVPVQPQVTPGRAYRVTAWVRGGDATGTTVVNISWFDGSGVYLSSTDSASLPSGDTPWTELQAAGAAPPRAAFAEIWLKSADNSGTAWFDDVTWTASPSGPHAARGS